MSEKVSHGRGGAANIRPDDTVYVDGGIVREGPVGDQGDGAYSAGRGGAGNIDGTHAVQARHVGDEEIVPETATVLAKEESHHFGRGGAGNVEHTHKKNKDKEKETINQYGFEKEVPKESLVDKVKDLFHKH